MRLIKAQSTNLRSIAGKGVKYDVNDIVQMDSDKAMLVPKGTSAERPSSAADGYIRYNTDDNRVEIYSGTEWTQLGGTGSGLNYAEATDIAVTMALIFG